MDTHIATFSVFPLVLCSRIEGKGKGKEDVSF